MKKKILVLLENPFVYDSRVEREIHSLVNAGYMVNLICWDREGNYPKHEAKMGGELQIYRIQYKAKRGQGLVYLLYKYTVMNILMIYHGCRVKADIIHSHNLETVLAGRVLKIIKKLPLIYDAHEVLGIYHYRINRWAGMLSIKAERLVSRSADTVIVVTEGMAKLFIQRGYKNDIKSIENYPLLNGNGNGAVNKNKGTITLGRIGSISREINAERIISSASELNKLGFKIEVLFAGPINSGYDEEFKELLSVHKEIAVYKGVIPSDRVLSAYSNIDISINIPTPLPEFKYGYSSKLFESMCAGVPIIHSDLGEVKRVIEGTHCGIVLADISENNIIDALKKLAGNKKLREELGVNGINAFRKQYNWNAVSPKLLTIYEDCFKCAAS